MPSSASKRSPKRSSVSQQVARVTLRDVQRPVADALEQVVSELRRVIAADFPIVSEVNDHLLHMKGKLFRPTLLLLSHQASGSKETRAVTLAAVVELIHLATSCRFDAALALSDAALQRLAHSSAYWTARYLVESAVDV